MQLVFYKYQGTGNDFIILDNRNNSFHLNQSDIALLCHRRFGIGADGFMLLNNKEGYDFEMKYYNADGAEGSMCGNGGRCLTKFAYDVGIMKDKYHFIASDGPHEAIVTETGWVKLKMIDVNKINQLSAACTVNTGSPHYVQQVKNLEEMNVVSEGKKIRYNNEYKENGINVNFVEKLNDGALYVRTYERGVEDETYSCGTGVTAAALIMSMERNNSHHMVTIKTKGGNLVVEFEKTGAESFQHIWLCGPAELVFKGTINVNGTSKV